MTIFLFSLLAFILGIVAGHFGSKFLAMGDEKDGTLYIDCTDLDKDVYRFDIEDIGKLTKKKSVSFNVEYISDDTHN